MTTDLEFVIPADKWLSSNMRLHWAAEAKRTAWLRDVARLRVMASLVTYAEPVEIVAHIGYPTNGKADPNNAAPTTKALIDGLVEAGMFVDDSHEWVIGPDHRRAPEKSARGTHTVRLEIRRRPEGGASGLGED